tara:strand:+ start:215 stop:316 length:102 start_codon:yes stop_codon:yes gene_type:complete
VVEAARQYSKINNTCMLLPLHSLSISEQGTVVY